MGPSKITSAAFVCIFAADQAAGFAPATSRVPQLSSPQTSLSMSVAHFENEDEAARLLRRASACAHSDSCSLEMAEDYLREIVHIQSGCAAGTLSGGFLCDDVTYAAEVVADLREKVRQGVRREARTFWEQRQDEFETLVTSSLSGSAGLSPTAALTRAPIKPAYLAIAALYTIAVISILQPHDASTAAVVPFQAQEIWWAIRDGYIGDLAAHWARNGGLSIADSAVSSSSAIISPQEMWWALRDGYFSDVSFGNHNSVVDGTQVSAIKPQEVWWAVRDGYAGDMIGDFWRNGGLLN